VTWSAQSGAKTLLLLLLLEFEELHWAWASSWALAACRGVPSSLHWAVVWQRVRGADEAGKACLGVVGENRGVGASLVGKACPGATAWCPGGRGTCPDEGQTADRELLGRAGLGVLPLGEVRPRVCLLRVALGGMVWRVGLKGCRQGVLGPLEGLLQGEAPRVGVQGGPVALGDLLRVVGGLVVVLGLAVGWVACYRGWGWFVWLKIVAVRWDRWSSELHPNWVEVPLMPRPVTVRRNQVSDWTWGRRDGCKVWDCSIAAELDRGKPYRSLRLGPSSVPSWHGCQGRAL
jgi:hypothetical protein